MIAGGWLPAPQDLTVWRELRVFVTADEEMTVNSFLMWDPATRAAALFDTGMDAQTALDALQLKV